MRSLATLAQRTLKNNEDGYRSHFPIMDDLSIVFADLYSEQRDPDATMGVPFEMMVMKGKQYSYFSRSAIGGFGDKNEFDDDHLKYQQNVNTYGAPQRSFGIFL